MTEAETELINEVGQWSITFSAIPNYDMSVNSLNYIWAFVFNKEILN